MTAQKLTPKTQAEKDHCAHVLFALSDSGVTGDWADMVDFAMRRFKTDTVHATVMKWIRAHPQKIERAYTEVQNEEAR